MHTALRVIRDRALAATMASLLAVAGTPLRAQTVTPVPKLNLAGFTQPWYEIERLPNRREKGCVGDNLILYGLNDKKNTFQYALSCLIKNNNWNYWDQSGKLGPQGGGRLSIVHLWIFHFKYWVIAADPDMRWMLVGTPNHKTLWLLSRTPTVSGQTLATMEEQARTQGFQTAKLLKVPQHGSTMNPDAGLLSSLSSQSGAAPTVIPQTPTAPETKLAPAKPTNQPATAPPTH